MTFSRYRITNTRCLQNGFQTGALIVDLTDTPMGTISVCNVHIHSYEEDKRLPEIQQVLSYEHNCDHQIILGDFNAISITDPYPSVTAPEFERRFEVTDKIAQRNLVDLHEKLTKGSN